VRSRAPPRVAAMPGLGQLARWACSGLPGPGRPPFCQSPTGTSPYSAGPGAAPGLPGALMSAGRPCLKGGNALYLLQRRRRAI
jgi:hypothetical protein